MQWTPGGSDQDIEDRRDDSGGGGRLAVLGVCTSALEACWLSES